MKKFMLKQKSLLSVLSLLTVTLLSVPFSSKKVIFFLDTEQE
jgi:hypothetical protein